MKQRFFVLLVIKIMLGHIESESWDQDFSYSIFSGDWKYKWSLPDWDHDPVDIKLFNDILHMSFLAGTHVFKAFPAYTTTELWVRTKCSSICSVSVELYL